MWHSLWLFARGTARYWRVLASGCVVSVAGWILNVSGRSAIPLRWFLGGAALLFLVAMVRAFHDVRVERDTLQRQITAAQNTRPRLTFDESRWIPTYPNGAQYRFHVLQVWLKNEPLVRGPDSVARHVSLTLTFYSSNYAEMVKLRSEWLSVLDPQLARYGPHESLVDIPASNVPARFILVLQHPETDDDCYAHSFGILDHNPDGRLDRFRLPVGDYRVAVDLEGDNIRQRLWLRFVNHGRAMAPEVFPIH